MERNTSTVARIEFKHLTNCDVARSTSTCFPPTTPRKKSRTRRSALAPVCPEAREGSRRPKYEAIIREHFFVSWSGAGPGPGPEMRAVVLTPHTPWSNENPPPVQTG